MLYSLSENIIGLSDGRRDSPFLTLEQWHDALKESSFSGLDVTINESGKNGQISTLMVSRALDSPNKSNPSCVKLIKGVCGIPKAMTDYLSALFLALENVGKKMSYTSWGSELLVKDAIYVVLDDGENPLLANPSSQRFAQIISLVRDGFNVFWVSVQERASATVNLEKHLINGLVRTAHAENEHLNFVTIDVQQSMDRNRTEQLRTIGKVLINSFCTSVDHIR